MAGKSGCIHRFNIFGDNLLMAEALIGVGLRYIENIFAATYC
jgi:hypothetical protein